MLVVMQMALQLVTNIRERIDLQEKVVTYRLHGTEVRSDVDVHDLPAGHINLRLCRGWII